MRTGTLRNPLKSRRGDRSSRLSVESLEDRSMLAAMISVGDASILEGNSGVKNAAVVVSLTEPHGNSVTVNYNTVNGSALAGIDYTATSGKLTFARGELSKTVLVPLRGDRLVEIDEYFSLQLSDAKGAKFSDSAAIVTILDNEPRIRIDDVTQLEGNASTSPFAFKVSLSNSYDMPVTIGYTTANGSASAGSDYLAATGTITIAAGQTSQTLPIAVMGDVLPEWQKDFRVELTSSDSFAQLQKGVGIGTIVDNEPRISIVDSYNYGESTFTFTVSLQVAYEQVVTVDFTTMDGSAIAGLDYVATSGTVIFEIGQTTATFTVEVLNPVSVGQYFTVHLSNATGNALIATEFAWGNWYYDYWYDYGSGGYGYYEYDYYGYYY